MTSLNAVGPADVVTIIGAGLAGAACARTLADAGQPVRLIERGRAPGGRMAAPLLHGRRVDIGAAYFTVRDPDFADVVGRWERDGLATPWTDTTTVFSGEGRTDRPGPMRWSTTGGLRSLVRAILGDLPVVLGEEVREIPSGQVVLAMPDAQAARLAPDLLAQVGAIENDPVIAVVAGYPERRWSLDAAFVNDDPSVAFLADDGSRRGDGAAVLVAHTTPGLARRVLAGDDADPANALEPVLATMERLLDVGRPEWTHVHRWGMAKPTSSHAATYHWSGELGLIGDQWAAGETPRVESAWRSGIDLAHKLLRR